ncbi:MAG: hypothetical protein HY854_07420 [Burkholderiales bacterium]|nr:hypothetical protein [Burkholderiales bacterium]
MKSYLLIPLAAVFLAATAHAQTKIWRCGNTYTNNEAQARAAGCRLVEGGNLTVVEGTRVHGSGAAPATPAAASNGGTKVASAPPRIDTGEQKARDAEARAILEAELKKAEARQAELQKEYNNGEPEKMGPEHRNHQKYLDRVAELKASIARNETDIAGIRRELARLGGTVPASR